MEHDVQRYSIAFWPMAALFNHSWVSNDWRSFIGDMIIIRASNDLDADTEVTISYIQPTEESDERQILHRNWGFECRCSICNDHKFTSRQTLTKRKQLQEKMWILHEGLLTPTPPTSEEDLQQLAQTCTHPASLVPRLSLADFNLARAQFYATHSKPMKVIRSMLNALQSLGYDIDLPESSGRPMQIRKWGIMNADLVLGWMALISTYNVVVPDFAAQAKGYAKLIYKITVGEDETDFRSVSKLPILP